MNHSPRHLKFKGRTVEVTKRFREDRHGSEEDDRAEKEALEQADTERPSERADTEPCRGEP